MEIEEVHEGPQEITEDNVIYWSRTCRELKGSITTKAQKFLKHNCIHYLGYDSTFDSKYTFICLPLNTAEEFKHKDLILKKKPFSKDYNSSEYLMYRQEDGRWICNCMGWRNIEKQKDKKRDDGFQCSHLLSLLLSFKIKRFGKDKGAREEDTEAERDDREM